MTFPKDVLNIDVDQTISSIISSIRQQVGSILHRKGAVIGVSGGIDSAVSAALSVQALGKDRVLVLLMPDRDSSSDSLRLGQRLVEALGVTHIIENITPSLEAAGCYRRQAEAIKAIFPDYQENWKFKITMPSILDGDRLNISRLTVHTPSGEALTERMPASAYLQLVAATNFKQRVRKMMEYYHADRLGYAVCGTPNRLEYDQGFFVKLGDGSADFKPIAHLYKSQVYMLAQSLNIPNEICKRTPTTDTFSLPQTQEEFFFALPYDKMDLCLYGYNHRVSPEEVAKAVGISVEQAKRVFTDIESKRRGTLPLHLSSLMVEPVKEISQLIHTKLHS